MVAFFVSRKDVLIFLLISFLLLSSVYSNFIQIAFSQPDDDWMLLENVLVTQFEFTYSYFKNVFTQINDIQYSPINTIYYAVIYKIDGYNSFYYHLFSIIFHFVNFILFLLIISKLIPEFKDDRLLVANIGLLWLMHPLNVESVIWISASKVVLSTTFFLISIYFLFTINQKWKRIFLISISLSIACLIKEQSVLFPVVFLIIDLLFYRKRVDIKEYLIYFSIAVLFSIITLQINKSSMELVGFTFLERISLSFYSIFWYVFNSIIPYNLHYHYPFPIIPGQELPWQNLFFIIVTVIFLIAIIGFKFYKYQYFYLIVISFVLISLSLHIIPMYRKSICADRYMYQPLLFLLPVFSKLFLTDNATFRKRKYMIALCFLIFFCIYSNLLIENWINLNLK